MTLSLVGRRQLLSFSGCIRPRQIRTVCTDNDVGYVQGQSPEPRIREYFYYIDHQGMLFLDDSKMKNFTSCFKERKFLHFFFTRIRVNETGRYGKVFPYVSLCGRERNYIRCDDLPIVFTHVFIDGQARNQFSYGHAGELLSFPFQPESICMLPESGRIYHPAPERAGGVGLIKSSLAIEFSTYFKYASDTDCDSECPTHFTWNGISYKLNGCLIPLLKEMHKLNK